MGRPPGKASDTKARIEKAAMQLFAEKGYGQTTTKDIAAAVGMKDASLYNHFKSKRELFDSAIASFTGELADQLREREAMADISDSVEPYAAADDSSVVAVILDSLEPLFVNERVVLLRHVLESNRHADESCRKLHENIFIERPLQIQQRIFDVLIARGLFASCDTRLAAMRFYGLPFLLLSQDATWEEALPVLREHIISFREAHESKERRQEEVVR